MEQCPHSSVDRALPSGGRDLRSSRSGGIQKPTFWWVFVYLLTRSNGVFREAKNSIAWRCHAPSLRSGGTRTLPTKAGVFLSLLTRSSEVKIFPCWCNYGPVVPHTKSSLRSTCESTQAVTPIRYNSFVTPISLDSNKISLVAAHNIEFGAAIL